MICEKHFYEDARSYEKQRASLKWNPIPMKRGPHCGKRQLNELNVELWRKLSKIMNVEPDLLPEFWLVDCISSLAEIERRFSNVLQNCV